MTSTLNSSSISSSIIGLVAPSVESIELRSELVARMAARMNEMPNDVVRQLLSPHASRLPGSPTDRLVPLIGELVQASSTNEPMDLRLSEERELAISTGLSVAMRWLHSMERQVGAPLTLRIILKSLMPLYLAAGQGRVGTSFVDTFSLIRVTCMVPELDRLTHANELALWLAEQSGGNNDPLESIPKSFRISLPLMANKFWSEIASKSNGGVSQPKKLVDSNSLTVAKHKAWWSLAGQLCNQRAQITIPAELSVGFVAWEKLLDHWQRVSQALSAGTTATEEVITNPPRPNSREEDLIENKKRTEDSKRSETTLLKKKMIAVKDEKDPKLADDHRFVEIRSVRDPQLSSSLDQLLHQSRNDQGTLSLMVVKKLGVEAAANSQSLQNWQSSFIEYMDTHGEAANVRGFVSDEGELTLVFQDVDRAELAQWIRESFGTFNTASSDASIATPTAQPLVAGVAMVNAPSRSFKIDQLIQAAWRCLEGASTQGSGAIKTIEVY